MVSASPSSFSTQASNFSFLRRSAACSVMRTVPIPNFREHSDNTILAESFTLMSATRAQFFLLLGVAAALARALLITLVGGGMEFPLWRVRLTMARGWMGSGMYQNV